MYIPHSDEEVSEILKSLGLSSLEDLFSHIEKDLLVPPKLDPPLSEEEIRETFRDLSSKNRTLITFAGFGAYDRIVPSAVWQILNRGEFLTSYTPYQAEASQGTLQSLFEYQTLICQLTGMDVASAGIYDGASALAEAILMAKSIRGGGRRVILSQGVHPFYRSVVHTYLMGHKDEMLTVPLCHEGYTDLDVLKNGMDNAYALAVQYPNFLGFVEPLKEIGKLARERFVPLIVVADPIALALLKPPGEFGADIVVGEGQQLGIPLNFGGPYAGFFATKEEYIRKMPGRVSGVGEDIEGRRAFTLVLQTREQHIRREKATSNICTNQNLMAIANAIYMVLLGKEGIREVAYQSISKALYLKSKLLELGFEDVFSGKHLWEFPLKHPKANYVRKELLEHGFLFGVPLERYGYKDTLLIAVTEKRRRKEMDRALYFLKSGLD
ncbi:MAG: aminomethyl-transferring glycine dehydrogenase subunit GcvPA [Aquificaceae bacterium]